MARSKGKVMRYGARALVPLGLFLTVGMGCTTASMAPAPVTEIRADAPSDVVRGRVVQALATEGLVLSSPPGPREITATAASGAIAPAWVVCPHFWHEDDTSFFPRWQVVRPTPLRAVVTVSLVPSDGTTLVHVEARFTGSYLDSFVNLTRKAACRSTGVLERRLLDAARG